MHPNQKGFTKSLRCGEMKNTETDYLNYECYKIQNSNLKSISSFFPIFLFFTILNIDSQIVHFFQIFVMLIANL